jgi:hypothetical protein
MARRAVSRVQETDASEDLLGAVSRFVNNPLGFVLAMFPWGEEGTPLAEEEGPDLWQAKVLHEIGERLKRAASEAEAREAIRIAVASGHGIGKTALVAWVILWFIATRANPQIVVTANTKNQLEGKTWRELAKWHKLSLCEGWFMWTATKFYHKAAPDTWFASAVPWTKERAEAFAGTHEKHVLLVFDEASSIADEIWEVAEGALTTAGAMQICFGNPTRNTGRFRECWRRFRHRWFTLKVDSRTAKKANRAQLQAWVDDYGEDSDFVRVRVRGEFPRASSNQFIATDDVEQAVARFAAAERRKREAARLNDPEVAARLRLSVDDGGDDGAPLILGVDVARFGDDSTVLYERRGLVAKIVMRLQGLDTVQVAARVAEHIGLRRPDAVFVDGVGVGAGVVDQLRSLGFEVVDCQAGAKALDERQFYNRRVEMWAGVRKWLRAGGMIEDDAQLKDDLQAPEYGFAGRGDQLQLESKDDMRARGLPSPDAADALALTFYAPVARREAADAARVSRWMEAMLGAGSTSHMAH